MEENRSVSMLKVLLGAASILLTVEQSSSMAGLQPFGQGQHEDINAVDPRGRTALHDAVLSGNFDRVSYLIAHGANINAADRYGETPLFTAVQEGHEDVVRFLIEHGADVNAANPRGQTPLHLAERYRHTDIVRYLRGHGANG
jgi:cytohesin